MNAKRMFKLGGGGITIALVIFLLFVNEKFYLKESYKISFDEVSTIDEDRLIYFEKNQYYKEREYEFLSIYSSPTDIVFVGDSLTQKCQWNELFPNCNVKNRGIGSDTTDGLLTRLDSVIKTNPHIVFIMIGINDISMGIPEQETINNYSAIIDKLKAALPNSYIYIQSILPCANEEGDLFNEKIISYNKSIQQLSLDKKCYYVNLYSLFADENGYLKNEFSYDNIHITSRGYEIWYSEINEICKGKLK